MKRKCHPVKSMVFGFKVLCALVVVPVVIYQTKPVKVSFNRALQFYQTLKKDTKGIQNNIDSTPGNGIPKIIHQIWNTDLIPAVFHGNIIGLVGHNKPPDWKYYFWTLQTGEQFINETFPRLLQRYTKASNLLKADILRLAVLYTYGGVYFDLDTVSVKPLDSYVETHNCSLVTDPPEHVFSTDGPKPILLITNSAILCSPSNWFILHIIEQLQNQPFSCNDAVSCTGPRFISKHYEQFNATSKSSELPIIENYEYFEDMVDGSAHTNLKKHCLEPFTKLRQEWSREICRNWIRRGRDKRNISDKAYTYHTWFHTYFRQKARKLREGVEKTIKDLVPNVKFFSSNSTLR